MSSAGAAADAGHGRRAKVLAGDPVACGVLDLARSLPVDEWDAFARSVERIRAGVPVTDVLAALWQERGEEHPRFG